ncbi:MAG TPA: glutathione-independent formaldehyde dehydrogenase, partial [Candidatus Saccharimonadales bacterium]|nr:glutathione-independent formaldehyde dehydrogenase [Candidatus Saccharimonadales bacterium]
ICGSDLHMYGGRTGVEEGKVLGHEIMGIIEEVGDGVNQLKVGDRVVLPFNIACGNCYNCVRGWTNACLTMNPESAGAAYGYAAMGPYQGGQAEMVRVPFADFNALKLPGNENDELEHDFLMLADIFPTAWHACELADVTIGKSVVIYGAGPVGLLSILSARLRGAAEIYCIDAVDSRLAKAREMGAIPIDFRKGKPSEQIIALRKKSLLADAMRPGEEKRLQGVDCGIDAIGYQAHDFKNPADEEANEVLEDLAAVVVPTGHVGLIGVYMPDDPGAPNDDLKQGIMKMPIGLFWSKGIAIGMGQCPVKKYNEFLRDMIIAGKARPGSIVSHDVPLTDAAEYYQRFNEREEGMTKVVLHP